MDAADTAAAGRPFLRPVRHLAACRRQLRHRRRKPHRVWTTHRYRADGGERSQEDSAQDGHTGQQVSQQTAVQPHCTVKQVVLYKNSSGDEIANVLVNDDIAHT